MRVTRRSATQALADHVLAALEGRNACLLVNHSLIACEDSLPGALAMAIEVENLARTYLQARMLGEPPHLSSPVTAGRHKSARLDPCHTHVASGSGTKNKPPQVRANETANNAPGAQ